jgi:SAM-dependent methyltransferase
LASDTLRRNFGPDLREGVVERPSWAPPGIDIDQPSIARIYDYMLGGFHNFAVDRAVGDRSVQLIPEARAVAQANRAFLARAVRSCVDAGVTQFLDIGSGIPTVGNVHEIAQQASDKARVVYVDIDPVAVAHSKAILAGDERTTAVQGVLGHPERLLAHPDLRRILDLRQPVALMMVFLLHFVPDSDDPAGIIERFRRGLAPGSYLIISTGAKDALRHRRIGEARELYEKAVARLVPRTRDEVAALFGRFEPVEPGVVAIGDWRPDPGDQVSATDVPFAYAGVGRAP